MAMLSAWGLICTAATEPVSVQRRLELMGTRLTVSVKANSRPAALAAAEDALDALETVEARLSTWRPDTELSRLNACPAGVPFTMSAELRRELDDTHRWYLATDAAFDPAVRALTEVWGLRTGGRTPTPGELRTALKATGFGKLHFEGNRVTRLPGVRIDEGGFGKGAGLNAALDALRQSEATSAVLNLGGQVALFGDAGPVEIQVAHPRDRDRPVLSVSVGQGSVATSGNSERGLVIDGKPVGHLFDPRSGKPARDFGSLTVWAPDSLTADCLSTGLYVLGPEKALQLALGWPGIEVLVLETTDNGLIARFTPGLAKTIQLWDSGIQLEPMKSTTSVR